MNIVCLINFLFFCDFFITTSIPSNNDFLYWILHFLYFFPFLIWPKVLFSDSFEWEHEIKDTKSSIYSCTICRHTHLYFNQYRKATVLFKNIQTSSHLISIFMLEFFNENINSLLFPYPCPSICPCYIPLLTHPPFLFQFQSHMPDFLFLKL